MRTLSVRLIVLVVFALLGPASALAQAQWGEPINTPGDRFIVLTSYNNQAVYDKETGLVWEQSPDFTSRTWLNAQYHCNLMTVGNRQGWRLPTFQELASLIDPTSNSHMGTLPAGHPFSNVVGSLYWSATTDSTSSANAWYVSFTSVVSSGTIPKANSRYVWCVRGGQGVDPQ